MGCAPGARGGRARRSGGVVTSRRRYGRAALEHRGPTLVTPGPDGAPARFPATRVRGILASLSGCPDVAVTCEAVYDADPGDVPGARALVIRWGAYGASRGGSIRLASVIVAEGAAAAGSVEGALAASRPAAPAPRKAGGARRTIVTRGADLPRIVEPDCDGAAVCLEVAWEAREATARAILGTDFDRVCAA